MTENENIVALEDEDLDDVVGGVFNSDMIAKDGLDTKIGNSGQIGLWMKFEYHYPGKGGSRDGWCSESSLKTHLGHPEFQSAQVRTKDGSFITYDRAQLEALVSG